MKQDYWPTSAWRTAAAQEMGMDPAMPAALDAMIGAGGYENLDGILVARYGYIVHERYYHGKEADQPQNTASVTKSVLSALIGIAIEEETFPSLQDRVLDCFPEYSQTSGSDSTAGIRGDVTLRHLLTMTAPFPFPNRQEPLDHMRRQPDWIGYALELMGRGGRIGDFSYSTAGAHILSAVLTRRVGLTAREYANARLFRPIGMREIPENPMQTFDHEDIFGDYVTGWVHDPAGYSAGGWGLSLTLRDMARFGLLCLNGGRWDQQQIVPTFWLQDSVRMNEYGYGYMWWLKDSDGVFSFTALGSGGSVICCLPEKDLLIAVSSKIVPRFRDRRQLIDACILPALRF